MKHLCRWVILSLFVSLIGVTPPLWAKDREVVAILPFAIQSAENIDYMRLGIANMLTSRLSGNEKIAVVDKDRLQTALGGAINGEPSAEAVVALGKKLAADFVVSGAITKIGNGLNIDGKLFSVSEAKAPLVVSIQCQSVDEVIPKITDFARKIDAYISGTPLQAAPAQQSREIVVSRPTAAATPQPSREAEIISGMKGNKRGTMTSSINPDFINAEQPLNRDTFWKSQQFSYEIRGIDVGDVNGDGVNETVVISSNSVFIYQRQKNDLVLLQQLPGKSYDQYVAVDVADINQNGIKEIIVSNCVNKTISSFVIEYKGGKFATIASDLPWFLRVIEDGSGAPVLLGQRMGLKQVFENPIHEIVWQSGTYREGKRMKIPEGIAVYGMTMGKLTPGGSEKVIALVEDDYLCIFEPTEKPLSKILIFGGSSELLWKSDEPFGGSYTKIDAPRGITADPYELVTTTFANIRILTYDTNRDGKREVIVVKNISGSGRLFQQIKLFTAAEVYDLEWDTLGGLVENWRTKKMTGYISDIQFKDIDNDGENEIVLALVVSTGDSLHGGRSVVVSYDLQGQ